MNLKRILGLIILVIGVGLVIYGYYGKQDMAAARADIDSKTAIIPNNPIKGIVKGELQSRVDQYEGPVRMLFIGGAALIVIGGVLLIFGRSRKNAK
ncbi:MAG: hypothetical protein K940chlam2_00560 [Chlamydiae bacterium]|nr:hypothetical protein [Chlamydiota bacterium]